MTPEQKAKELFNKISWTIVLGGQSVRSAGIIERAKTITLIAVDEILKEAIGDGHSWSINAYWLNDKYISSKLWKEFWLNVKEEINKL